MKNRNYFWGGFILTLGILLLLENLKFLHPDFASLYKFWPLILILWGVLFLKISDLFKKILSALNGILLAVVVVAAVLSIIFSLTNSSNFYFSSHKTSYNSKLQYEPTQKTVEYTNEESAELNFSGGASYLRLGSGTEKLVAGYADFNSFVINKSILNNNSTVDLDFDPNFEYSIDKSQKSKIDVLLNEKPNWIINVDAGASKLDFDLSKIKLDRMSIEVGISDISLMFGDLSNFSKVDISCGLSNIRIKLPENTGCRIITETAFSSHNFDNFSQKDNSYYSKNYYKSTKKIEFEIDGAFSNFEIVQY